MQGDTIFWELGFYTDQPKENADEGFHNSKLDFHKISLRFAGILGRKNILDAPTRCERWDIRIIC